MKRIRKQVTESARCPLCNRQVKLGRLKPEVSWAEGAPFYDLHNCKMSLAMVHPIDGNFKRVHAI